MAALKARCEDARAPSIIQSGESEQMIIYNGKLSASRRSLSDACSRLVMGAHLTSLFKRHEVLMAYLSDFVCYMTKHGQPSWKCEIIRWETPADGCSRIYYKWACSPCLPGIHQVPRCCYWKTHGTSLSFVFLRTPPILLILFSSCYSPAD